MKKIEFYEKTLKCNTADEVFNHIISTFKPSILTWSYFVNWDKVFQNTKDIEIGLNKLNYLIGKEDFDKEFRYLIKKEAELLKIIPALVVRDGQNTLKFKILVDYSQKKMVYEEYDFNKDTLTDENIEKCLTFVKETGLKKLITSGSIKNLVDYMIGVEAGLDSNGRKNRSGSAMENIVEMFIKDICNRKNFRYLRQADAKKIKEEFGYDVPVDKSSRRYDFVIDTGKELVLFETNFYGGGGSKLKSTAGEYRNLFDILEDKYKFIWITDGLGWKTTQKPLRETFEHNDYLFNLDMLEKKVLDVVL
ncbi:MAG: type II restriction endonuclease [archaeon]